MPLPAAAAAFCAGRLAWWLVEYSLHRFLFHAQPASYWGITLHYSFHGCHHKHPNDRLRLVFPPLFAAPLVFLFARLCRAAAAPGPAGLHWGLFAGMLAGYVAYDVIHHFTHAAGPPAAWLAGVRRRHLGHHYKDCSRSFGVSSHLFDVVFGTLPLPVK